MIASWIALLISPHFALQEKGLWRLRGVMSHEFELGYLCACCFLISFANIISGIGNISGYRMIVLLIILTLSFITLFATQTRTLLAYTALSTILISLVHVRSRTRFISIIAIVAVTFAVSLFTEQIQDSFSRGESDSTLSGRTLIWERSIAETDSRPLTGHGYASFASSSFDYIWSGFYRPAHAHNTWVMSYFELGIIGVVLITWFLAVQLFTLYKSNNHAGSKTPTFYIAFLCTIAGFTSLIFGGKLSPMMAIILLLCFQEYNHRVRLTKIDVKI
jgi:O-antigen ligase